MKKDSRQTTLMANDLTLRGRFAMNAPDVPDWFGIIRGDLKNDEYLELRFIRWLEYYADLMIKHFGYEPAPVLTNNIARVIPESDLKYFAKLNPKNQ
jgi:hypothetical protein